MCAVANGSAMVLSTFACNARRKLYVVHGYVCGHFAKLAVLA